MKNKDILKRQIIYRSKHRGRKEMDLLLGAFVNKYIDSFNDKELKDLHSLLNIDDDILYKWYLDSNSKELVPVSNISQKLKHFKL